MTFRKFFLFLIIPGLIALPLVGCGHHDNPWKDSQAGQKRVLAVTPPLFCFAKQIGGDHVAVLCLLGDKGPHDYEPTGQDAQKARKAELFLANGLELDDFVAKVALVSGNKNLDIFKVANQLPKENLIAPHEHGPDAVAHDDHDHGIYDPHVWLSPDRAKEIAGLIHDKLKALDPDNAAAYASNLKTFQARLDKLKTDGLKKLAGKRFRNVLPMHDSMRYFGNAFEIRVQEPIHEKPGWEAEPARLKRLGDKCLKKSIRIICVEPQYGKGPADALLKFLEDHGHKAVIAEFDPIETIVANETLDADYYFRRMEHNLDTMARAMDEVAGLVAEQEKREAAGTKK